MRSSVKLPTSYVALPDHLANSIEFLGLAPADFVKTDLGGTLAVVGDVGLNLCCSMAAHCPLVQGRTRTASEDALSICNKIKDLAHEFTYKR